MAYEAETPRLYLERLSIDKHFEDFWEMWTDPRSMVWSTQAPKRTAEEAKEWMLLQLPNEKNPNIDKFALLLKPSPANPQPWLNAKGEPKAIGVVGTNRDSPQGLETGYCINIAYWGHGYASEGFAAFLKLFWALEERQNVGFLVAKADPENFASARILEKSRARKGELLTGIWKRKLEDGQEQERDLICWIVDRPGIEERKAKDGEKTDPVRATSGT